MIFLLDSDDEIIPSCLELLLHAWDNIPIDKRYLYREICAQCMDEKGNRVGDPFPENINDAQWEEAIRMCEATKGEHVGFNLTRMLKENPWPEPEGITFVTEGTVWKSLEKKYRTYFLNDMVKIYHSDSGNTLTSKGLCINKVYISAGSMV